MKLSPLSAAAILQFVGLIHGAPPGRLEERNAELVIPRSAVPDASLAPGQSFEKRDHCSRPVVDKKDVTITFNGLRPYCFRDCPPVTKNPINTPKGAGYLFTTAGTKDPLFLPNIDNWHVIECSAFPGQPLGGACGTGQNDKALWSPGRSPYKPEQRFVSLGSCKFYDDYLRFDLVELYITPFIDAPGASKARVYIQSSEKDAPGALTEFVVENNKRTKLTFGKGFFDICQLGFEVKMVGAEDSDKAYPFAIDDILVTEYQRNLRPVECNATPNGLPGPCKPQPTQSTSFTANFDEFIATDFLPGNYKGVDWDTDRYRVMNQSSIKFGGGFGSRIEPGEVVPPSDKNFIFVDSNGLDIRASTYERRFGVKSMSVLCSYPREANPDYDLTNGKPCVVTFIGRRDPYDGSGLPTIVRVSVSIPNPGNDQSTRPFNIILLDELTSQAGGFSRLVSLRVFFTVGDYYRNVPAAVDDIVFTREIGEGESCRAPGASVLGFDDLTAGGANVPAVYNGFKFESGAWAVVGKSMYQPDTPGYRAVISPPNAARSMLASTKQVNPTISSYVTPAQEFLFDLESVTITFDIDPKDTARINDLQIHFRVEDACGTQPYTVGPDGNHDRVVEYSASFLPGKAQMTFNLPLLRISSIYMMPSYTPSSNFRYTSNFWIDNIKYRKYDGPTPGCYLCGYRGGELCELPVLVR